jgi:hypothetical protein
MIHVLVVALEGAALGELAGRRSGIEVLLARGADEAVEKLARNRRIDAVVLLSGAENAAVARAICEDNLSPPPIFAPASSEQIPGVRRLPGEAAGPVLDLVAEALAGA